MYHTIEFLIHAPLLHLYVYMCISVTYSELGMPTYKPDYSRSGESTFWNYIRIISKYIKKENV